MNAAPAMPALNPLFQHAAGLRSISFIAAGNLAGQALTIGSAPVLSRLYAPAEFGIFATVLTVVTIAGVVAPLALHQAVHVPREESTAIALTRASLKLTLIATAVFILAATAVCAVTGTLHWAFVPAAAAAAACIDILTYWSTREGRFRLLVQARFAGALLGVGAMLALSAWGVFGLLGGHTLGALATAGWLAAGFVRTAPAPAPDAPTLGNLLRRFRHFPQWRLPAGLLNATITQFPLWIFSHVFGPAAVGQFSLTQRVFNAPTAMLGSAITDVFQREAGLALRTRGECRPEFRRFAALLFGIAIVIAGIVAWFGPGLFAWAFGEPWRPAGELARWLTPLFLLRFVLSPLTALLILASRAGLDLALQIWLLIGSAAAWVTALHTGSVAATITVLTAAVAVFYAGSIAVAARIASGRLPVADVVPPANQG